MIDINAKKITVKEFHEMEFPETDLFIYELIITFKLEYLHI